jgi:hypothetical protein
MMRAAIPNDKKRPERRVQQQIGDLVHVGGDQNANLLVDIMIIDVAQLLQFKVVLGVMDRDNGLSE